MAKAQPDKVSFFGRLKQIGMVFSFTAKRDRLFLPLVIVAAVVPLALAGVVIAIGASLVWLAVGIMAALLAVMIVLNLRSNKAMMREAESQPGAAASIVETMRGDWRVTPAVASTTNFDMVHLVISRAGVILLGEGNPQRVRSLISQEKRRLSKVIGSADMRDIIIGKGEGEVPLAKLRTTLTKLPRTITGKDVNALDKRLKALAARPQLPKGAIPKNMRPPKGAFRAMRGR
jgi:heme exporter protein D